MKLILVKLFKIFEIKNSHFIIIFITFFYSYVSLNKSIYKKDNDSFHIDKSYISKAFNNRIRCLVIHYTAMNFKNSLKVLINKNVSSHYLIPDKLINGEKKIFLLVDEGFRSWHAGISSWQKRVNINDTSIGIEIVNLGNIKYSNKHLWVPFNNYQINILIELVKSIINKYHIEPTSVIGHSDISPGRKMDPGPLFPWKKLFEQGIGAWYDEEYVNILKKKLKNKDINILLIQKYLNIYGYNVKETGKLDKQTKITLSAFQIHFRPKNFSGIPDIETLAILKSLIKKYFNY